MGRRWAGQTHLLHAIGNYLLQQQEPDMQVLYITAEEFTNEMVESIKKNSPEDFRAHYRTVDVLLIDDIQFHCRQGSYSDRILPHVQHLVSGWKTNCHNQRSSTARANAARRQAQEPLPTRTYRGHTKTRL